MGGDNKYNLTGIDDAQTQTKSSYNLNGIDDAEKKNGTSDLNTPSSQQSQPSNQNGTNEPLSFLQEANAAFQKDKAAQNDGLDEEGRPKAINIQKVLDAKTGGQDYREYAYQQNNELLKKKAELSNHIDLLNEIPKQTDFQNYQNIAKQINDLAQKGTVKDGVIHFSDQKDLDAYKQLTQQLDDLKSKPFNPNLVAAQEGYKPTSESETASDAYQQDKINMQVLQQNLDAFKINQALQQPKTVGDLIDNYQQSSDKAKTLHADISKQSEDLKQVIDAARLMHSFRGNKDGVEELGIIPSAIKGFGDTFSDALFKAKYLLADNAGKQQMLQQRIAEQQIISPEKPSGDISELAQTAGGIAPYLIPGTAFEGALGKGVAATAGTLLSQGLLMGLSGGVNDMTQTYQEVLNKTGDNLQALQAATSLSHSSTIVGGLTGAVALPVFGKLGEKYGSNFVSDEINAEVAANGSKNLGFLDHLQYSLPKNVLSSLPFGFQQFINNEVAKANGSDRSALEGVGSNILGGIVAGGVMDNALHLMGKITANNAKEGDQSIYDKLVNSLAQFMPVESQKAIDDAVKAGIADAFPAQKVKDDITDREAAFASMGQGLSPDLKEQLLPLVLRQQELAKTIENGTGDAVRDAERELLPLQRQIDEMKGTPLDEKEMKRLGQLQTALNGENGLNEFEKAELEHLNKRNAAPGTYKYVGQERLPVSSIEDAAKLPKGTKYVTPEGQVNVSSGQTDVAKEAPTQVGKVSIGGHGEDEMTQAGVENGTEKPNDLTDKGKAEAEAQGEQVAKDNPNLTTVFHGTTDRVVETAKIVANKAAEVLGKAVKVVTQPLLDTWNIGKAEGNAPEGSFDEREWAYKKPELKPDKSNENIVLNLEFLNKGIGNVIYKEADGYYYTKNGVKTKIPNQARAEKAFNESKQSESEILASQAESKGGGKIGDAIPPGGESWNSFVARAKQAWEFLKGQEGQEHAIASSKMERMLKSLNESDGDLDKAKEIYFNKLEAEKNNEDAIQKQSTGTVGAHEGGDESTGGQTGGEGVGQGKQGEKTAGEEKEVDGGKLAGISIRVMEQVAERLGITAPESGEGMSPKQLTELGRELLARGADPDKLIEDFNNGQGVRKEGAAIIRAQAEKLTKAADDAVDKFGANSPEAQAAKTALEEWLNKSKPYATEASNVFKAYQGATDVDTGSFVSLTRSFKEKNNRDPTPQEAAQLKTLSDEVKSQQKKLDDAINEISALKEKLATESPETKKTYTQRAKKIADDFRKLKTKPFVFTDEKGNEIPIHTMGITWNDAIELGAKAIELSGKIADGVAAAIEHLKDSDFYKNLSENDKERLAKELEKHYAEKDISSAESKNIARLEKQLADLQAGKVKEKTPKRELSEREVDLKNQIAAEKERLNLTKPDDDIQTRYADKKGNDFTPEEARDIWKYAKENYLDKQKSIQDMVRGVAIDLGLTQEQVNHAIALPKNQRTVTNDMYLAQRNYRKAVDAAKDYVEQAGKSPVDKFWNAVGNIPNLFRSAVTWGHGTVAPGTHVGLSLFNPSLIKQNMKFIFDTYHSAYVDAVKKGGLADFEQRVSNFKHDPMYGEALHWGADIDANIKDTDYAPAKSIFGKMGQIGDRGFFELKPYRLELIKHFWEQVPQSVKNDENLRAETGKMIAGMVNNMTGSGPRVIAEKLPASVVFAPKLVASRVARFINEPAQAVNTIIKMGTGDATPADKAALKIYGQHTASMIATYGIGLAVNQALLKVFGAKEDVNFTDSKKPDFLRFKSPSGYTVDPTAGMVSMFKFLSHIVAVPWLSMKEARGDRLSKMADELIKELRGKASPFAGVLYDFISGKDFEHNVVPGRNDKVPAGKEKLTWGQYIAKHLTPIPAQEAMVGKEHSLSDILVGLISGITGFRIGKKPDEEKTAAPAFKN